MTDEPILESFYPDEGSQLPFDFFDNRTIGGYDKPSDSSPKSAPTPDLTSLPGYTLPAVQETVPGYGGSFFNTFKLLSLNPNTVLNQTGKNYTNVNYFNQSEFNFLGNDTEFKTNVETALAIAGACLAPQYLSFYGIDGVTVGRKFAPWTGTLKWTADWDSYFDKIWKTDKQTRLKYLSLKSSLESNLRAEGVTLGLNAPLNMPVEFFRRPLKVSEVWTGGATYQYNPSEYGRWVNLRQYMFNVFIDPHLPFPMNTSISPGYKWGAQYAEKRELDESAPTINGYKSIQPENQLRGEARYELREVDVKQASELDWQIGTAVAAAYCKYKLDNGITRGAQNLLQQSTQIGGSPLIWTTVPIAQSGITYKTNYALAPDGTTSATLLIFTKSGTTSKYSFIRQFSPTTTSNRPLQYSLGQTTRIPGDLDTTFSVWVKRPGAMPEYPGATASNFIGLRRTTGNLIKPDDGGQISASLHSVFGFTASHGVTLINNQYGCYIGGKENYSDDWYRIWIKRESTNSDTPATTTTSICIPNPVTQDGNEYWANSGDTLGLLVWGAQLEDGTGPSDLTVSVNNSDYADFASPFFPQLYRTNEVNYNNFKQHFTKLFNVITGEAYTDPQEKLERRWVPLSRAAVKLPAGWNGDPASPADEQYMTPQAGFGFYGLYLGSAWKMRALVKILDAIEGKQIVDQSLFNKTKDLLKEELKKIAFVYNNCYRHRYNWSASNAYGQWNPLYWWALDSAYGIIGNQMLEPMVGGLLATMYLGNDQKILGTTHKTLYDLLIEYLRIHLDFMVGGGKEWREGIAYYSQSSWVTPVVAATKQQNNDTRITNYYSGENYFSGGLWFWALHMLMPGKRLVNYGDGISNMSYYFTRNDDIWLNALYGVLSSGETLGYESFKYFFPSTKSAYFAGSFSEPLAKWLDIHANISDQNVAPSGLTLYAYFPAIRLLTWRDKWERVHTIDNPTTFAVWAKGEARSDAHTHRDAGHFSVYNGNKIILGECGTQRPYVSPDNKAVHQASGHNIFRLFDVERNLTVNCPATVKYMGTTGFGITFNTSAAYIHPWYPGLTGITFCGRELYLTKQLSGITAEIIVKDNVVATSQTAGIIDFGATAWYHFHTGCTGGPSGLSLTITGNNKNWIVSWPETAMTISSDRGITVAQKDYEDFYNELDVKNPETRGYYPGINAWPGIHKCVEIICPQGCTGLSLSTKIDVLLSRAAPTSSSRPIFAATWLGAHTTYSGKYDLDDLKGLTYVVPIVWLDYNGRFSVDSNISASTSIETPTNYKTKILQIESELGVSLTNRLVIAPRRYWFAESFWGATSDNIPAGICWTAPTKVYRTPWAGAGIDGVSAEWGTWLDGYKTLNGPTLDYLVMDQENQNIANYWGILGITSSYGRTASDYLYGLTSDARWSTSYRGITALSELVAGISLNKLDVYPPYNPRCYGCTLEYIKFNEAIHHYGTEIVNKAVWDPFKARYPNGKASNYENLFMVNQPAPDINGHPQSYLKQFGSASSPSAYGWNQQAATSWWVDQENPTQLIYFNDRGLASGNVVPSDINNVLYNATPAIPDKGIEVGNAYRLPVNTWTSFLKDLQFGRACRRTAPTIPLQPWIANWRFGGTGPDTTTGLQYMDPDSGSRQTGAFYWQDKRYYYEMMRHYALLGTEVFLNWNTTPGFPPTSPFKEQGGNSGPWRIPDTHALNTTLSDINYVIGYSPVTETVTTNPISFVHRSAGITNSGNVVVTGAKTVDGVYVWRATVSPGVTMITNNYTQQTRILNQTSSDPVGFWEVTVANITPSYSIPSL